MLFKHNTTKKNLNNAIAEASIDLFQQLQKDHDQKVKAEAELAIWQKQPEDIQELRAAPIVPELQTQKIEKEAREALQVALKNSMQERGLDKKFDYNAQALDKGIDRVSTEMLNTIWPDKSKTFNFDYKASIVQRHAKKINIPCTLVFLASSALLYLGLYFYITEVQPRLNTLTSTKVAPAQYSFPRNCEHEYPNRYNYRNIMSEFESCARDRDHHYSGMQKEQYDQKLQSLTDYYQPFFNCMYTVVSIACISGYAAYNTFESAFLTSNSHGFNKEHLAVTKNASEIAEKYFETLKSIEITKSRATDTEANPIQETLRHRGHAATLATKTLDLSTQTI